MQLSQYIKVWPLTHIQGFFNLNSDSPPVVMKPYMTHPLQYLAKVIQMIPFLLISFTCVSIDPLESLIEEAQIWRAGWMTRVVVRDLILLFLFTGCWDFLLMSVLHSKMHPRKYNPKYPTFTQLKRDITFSISTTLFMSLFQVILLHKWATGELAYFQNWREHPWSIGFWVFGMYFWRDTHFYWIHRAMHPWRVEGIPDVGKWLYKHVHSLHHKSTNPSAWSGTAMHPVEGAIYVSCIFVPCFFTHHPFYIVVTKLHLLLTAVLGHDGHTLPGAGNYNHYLHHAYADCNYGTINAPFDWVFGNYEDGSGYPKERTRIIKYKQ